MSIADIRMGIDPPEFERMLRRERRKFFRMTREQIAVFMLQHGFEYKSYESHWTKRDAWTEYEGVLRTRLFR